MGMMAMAVRCQCCERADDEEEYGQHKCCRNGVLHGSLPPPQITGFALRPNVPAKFEPTCSAFKQLRRLTRVEARLPLKGENWQVRGPWPRTHRVVHIVRIYAEIQ